MQTCKKNGQYTENVNTSAWLLINSQNQSQKNQSAYVWHIHITNRVRSEWVSEW